MTRVAVFGTGSWGTAFAAVAGAPFALPLFAAPRSGTSLIAAR